MRLQKPAPGAVLAADRSGIKSVAAADVVDDGVKNLSKVAAAQCFKEPRLSFLVVQASRFAKVLEHECPRWLSTTSNK